MKVLLGLLLGFFLGAVCRWLEIPVPSPPKLLGALLVVATTLGYMAMDDMLARRHSAAAPHESARTLQVEPDR
jgi:XapX domain-containing protein